MKKAAIPVLVSSIVIGSLCACGGGGGGGGGNRGNANPPATPPVVNASPGGIFHGTVTGCSTVCPVATIMLVTESGEWIGMDPVYVGGANVGRITMSGSHFNDPRLLYGGSPVSFGFRPTLPATLDRPGDFRAFEGDVVERVSIEGDLIHNSSRGTKLAVTYDPIYENDSSLATIAGTYSASDPSGYTLTYLIDINGALSGSDTEGCMALGDVRVIDSNYNMYRFDIDFSSCGTLGAQGQYDGIGALLDAGGGAESLLFHVVADDDSRLVVLNLPKL